jgi:hypothetical protein
MGKILWPVVVRRVVWCIEVVKGGIGFVEAHAFSRRVGTAKVNEPIFRLSHMWRYVTPVPTRRHSAF